MTRERSSGPFVPVAVGLLIAVAVLAPAGFGMGDTRQPCPDFHPDAMTGGWVCTSPSGGLDVYTPEGILVTRTHGPDTLVPEPPPGPLEPLAAPRMPHCVFGPPVGSYHIQVIYMYPSDGVDDYANKAQLIRDVVMVANGVVYDAARATGATRGDLRVQCDAPNSIFVRKVESSVAPGDADFFEVRTDLVNKGFTDHRLKYWVFYDEQHEACLTEVPRCPAGQADIRPDDSLAVTNGNNGVATWGAYAGPMFAIIFGRLSPLVSLHELSHTMGAVQNSAPHPTGGFHCTDGFDVMCYRDDGPRANEYMPDDCPKTEFDCGRDDYFTANAGPGAYLSDHWNLGSAFNRYIRYQGVNPAIQRLEPIAGHIYVGCTVKPGDPAAASIDPVFVEFGCVDVYAVDPPLGVRNVNAYLNGVFQGSNWGTNELDRFTLEFQVLGLLGGGTLSIEAIGWSGRVSTLSVPILAYTGTP